jgi:hypothetical protein
MQNSKYRISIIALILSCVAIFFTWYQHYKIHLPFNPQAITHVWSVEAKLEFYANTSMPANVRLTIPSITDEKIVHLNESFISRNYGMNIKPNNYDREIQWSKRRAVGKQELYYRLDFYFLDNVVKTQRQVFPLPNVKPFYSQDGAEYVAVNSLLEPIRGYSSDIFTFVTQTIKVLNDKTNNNAKLLLNGDYSRENVADVAVKLLSMVHIKAENVYIVELIPGKNIKASNWLISYNGKTWEYFSPTTGVEGLPDNIFIWSLKTNNLASVFVGEDLVKSNLSFTVAQNKAHTVDLIKNISTKQYNKILEFSLFSLPLHLQQVFQVILMIPVGVFIILLLRVFIGIETFGTFMPVLIALSFRETGIAWGIMCFTIITIAGLLIRAYMESLKLLIVPRLSIVLTIVVVLMGILCVLCNKLDINNGLSIALFPIVILTMTIERMSILWEERGASVAYKTAASSLLAAVLAYLAMSQQLLNYWIFTFPGLLLVLVSLMLLTGRYRGFRLLEFFRFRELIFRRDLPK